MECASPPAVSRKRRQKLVTSSKDSPNKYIVPHLQPGKRKTRRARTADKTDSFNMRISKTNIPKSSRVLRSATQTLHVAESLSESLSCPHSYLADHHDPLTDPLHFEIGADVSSSEESPTDRHTESNRLLNKRGGSDHKDIYAGPSEDCFIKCDPDLNELAMENNNLSTQPNNNVVFDGQQRGSFNKLMAEPNQRAPNNRTANLTPISTAINLETQSQSDVSQESDLNHFLSDGSSFFEDYRWLLGFDTNDLAPELPEIGIDDIATLPNIDLDGSVPLTQIRPSLFQTETFGGDSVSTSISTNFQVLYSVTTRPAVQTMMSPHAPLCVSTSARRSPFYVSTNFQKVPQSRSFDTIVKSSVALPYSTTSGGTIERISSPVVTNQSVLTNTPSSPNIKQEFDFEPQCRIHLVDTPPSFTRMSELDATPIRHQVFGRQNYVYSDERTMINSRNWQQQSVAGQRTSGAQPNELQTSVHSAAPPIRTFQDRHRESFARPKSTSGAQVNERPNVVHPDEHPLNIRPDAMNPQHYQAVIFQGKPFMRTAVAGAATFRPSEYQVLVHSEEPPTITIQSRQQHSFTRTQRTSGAQLNEPQDAIKEHSFMLTPLTTATPHRLQSNKQQHSVHPEEPPIRTFRSRQQQLVERPQNTRADQPNELQSSVYAREPPRREFKSRWTTGAKASERPISVHSEGSPTRSFRSRQQESFARPHRTSRAPPNERQNSFPLDEPPMTTFQGQQEHLLGNLHRTSRPQANDTFRRDPPLQRTKTYNPQQYWAHSGSPIGRIYPRPFSRIPSAPIRSQVIERQNWHHSYQPQRETHHSWQENPSSATMAPLPDVIEAGPNLTSSEQNQRCQRTLRKRSRQTRAPMAASTRDIISQRYESATADADSYLCSRHLSLTGANYIRNTPSIARNEIISSEPIYGSNGEQEAFNSFTRSEVNSINGLHAEHRQNRFSPMLPSHSLPSNFISTSHGNADHSLHGERAHFVSLNLLSKFRY